MAVTQNLVSSSVGIVFSVGVNPETNNPITQTKSFSNINPAVTAEDVYATVQILSSLQSHSVVKIKRIDTYEIMNEE